MHIEHIHFDEVFDIQALRGDFSFTTRGRPTYGVNLGKHVIPRAGATFAIAFQKPGDWSSVLAWRDLTSTKVKFKQASCTAWLLAMGDFILFGSLCVGGGLGIAGEWMLASVFAALVAIAFLTVIIRGVKHNRIIEQALLAAA